MKIMQAIHKDNLEQYSNYRNIVDTIISIIPIFKDKNIEININNRIEQFYSGYELNFKQKEFMYYLNLGVESVNNKYSNIVFDINDLLNYFNMYNIEDNLINRWIFFVLHELGHTEYYIKYYTSVRNTRKMNLIEENQNNMLHMAFPVNSIKQDLNLYYLKSVELYANQFAYRYFPYIWNILKERGLI